MNPHPSRVRHAVIASLLLTTLVVTGCGKETSMSSLPPADQPASNAPIDVDEAVSRYDAMIGRMEDAIASATPGASWIEVKPAQRLGDTDPGGSPTAVAISALSGYDLPLPTGTARAAVLEAVEAIGHEYGFGDLQVYVDRDDEVQANAIDAAGSKYEIGSRARTTLSYSTAELPTS